MFSALSPLGLSTLGLTTLDLSTPAPLPPQVLDLSSDAPTSYLTTIQTCVGFYNTDPLSSGVYTLNTQNDILDEIWLATLFGFVQERTALPLFMEECLKSDYHSGYILYDYETQQSLLPNIITLAAVTNSLPLAASDAEALDLSALKLTADLSQTWADFTALDATKYMYSHHVYATTTLCKMNPGYTFEHPLRPEMGGSPDINLVDFMVAEKLFTMYLPHGCLPGFQEHDFFSTLVDPANNPWPNPAPVYGYDDTFPLFGGDTFEAETNCAPSHNLGQIASVGVNNLSYFKRFRKQEGDERTKKHPASATKDPVTFDKSKSYIALVIGDGDNIQFLKARNYIWWLARKQRCDASTGPLDKLCFPLVWSFSPRAASIIPSMQEFYFKEAETTGYDTFVLPPSGDLYSYPSMMKGETQDNHVARTVEDMAMLDTNASVHWEWFYSWRSAIDDYFPKFSPLVASAGFFLTNVPFAIPLVLFKPHEDFKIVGSAQNVVLFKPNEWRGTTGGTHQTASVADMAARINEARRGTVTHIYLTSDGGASLDTLYSLVGMLDDHVEVVGATELVDLALQKGIE